MKKTFLTLILVVSLMTSIIPAYAEAVGENTSAALPLNEFMQTEDYQNYALQRQEIEESGYTVLSEQAVIEKPNGDMELVPIDQVTRDPILAIIQFSGTPTRWKYDSITVDMAVTCTSKILWKGSVELNIYGSTGVGTIYGTGSGTFSSGVGYFTNQMYDSTSIYVGTKCPDRVRIKPSKLFITTSDGTQTEFYGAAFNVDKKDFK